MIVHHCHRSSFWKLLAAGLLLTLVGPTALVGQSPRTCPVPATSQLALLGPIDVVAAPDGKTLYVAGADAKMVFVVDADGGKISQSIAMSAEPTGLVLSPDGATLCVTCASPEGTVAVVDVNSGKVDRSIPVGHWPIGPTISPDGETLYVCNRFDNNLVVVGLKTERVAMVPTTREPYAAAVTPDGKSVFVINHLPIDRADAYEVASVVTAIDTATNKTQTIRLPNGTSGMRGICIAPDGKYAYVTHILSRYQMPTTQVERGWMNTNALSIIDARKRKLINTVLLDDVDRGAANPWGVLCTADGKTVCVTHAGTHELSIIDAESLLKKLLAMPEKKDPNSPYAQTTADVPNDLAFLTGLRRRVPLVGGGQRVNGPRGLTIVGSKAFVAAYFTDNLAVVDLEPRQDSAVDAIALGPVRRMSVQRRGEMLFNDATLCFQHWQSCATCHPGARVDALNWDLTSSGLGNPKNTRSMVLAHETPPSMSSGVRADAKIAVRGNLMHLLFARRAEEDAVVIDKYLESLKPVPSPYLVDGKLSPAAQRGKKLFFDAKINCAKCHPEPLFTDMLMHDVGSKGQYDRRDTFDTPTLIECWRTAPYMHDGRYTTMEEVFTKGRHGNVAGLDEQQIHDLSQYVLSLGPAEAAQIPPNRRIELPPITGSTGGATTPKSVEKDEPAVEALPPRAADLAAPVPITAGGKPIDVDGFAAPFVGDFDEDGIDDLLVGQVGFGRLRIYRNTGSNARPKFDGFDWFKAGGRIAAVPIGCQVGFTPHLADFDGDGRTDILTGSFYGGGLYVFRRNEDGTFAEGEVLENKHGEVLLGYSFSINRAVPYNTTVFLHDWDGDGDGDLLTGKTNYSVVPNEGTRRRPVFGDALPLLADGELIPRGMVPPCVADWDGDGRHDLLVGRGSDIVWYRNTGRDRRPVLQPARILVSRSGWAHEHQREFSIKSAARPQAICTADFNGDGRLDLLVGDCYYSERMLTEAQKAELAKVAKAGSEIRARCTNLIQDEPKNETRQQRIERFRKVLATWSELGDLPWAAGGQGAGFDKERHGRVWLYERRDRKCLGAAKPRSTLKRSNGGSSTTP